MFTYSDEEVKAFEPVNELLANLSRQMCHRTVDLYLIIPKVMEQFGYGPVSPNQKNDYRKYGDHSGDDVWLKKQLSPDKGEVCIDFWHGDWVYISVFEPNEKLLQAYPDAQVNDEGWARLDRMTYQTREPDWDRICSMNSRTEKNVWTPWLKNSSAWEASCPGGDGRCIAPLRAAGTDLCASATRASSPVSGWYGLRSSYIFSTHIDRRFFQGGMFGL